MGARRPERAAFSGTPSVIIVCGRRANAVVARKSLRIIGATRAVFPHRRARRGLSPKASAQVRAEGAPTFARHG